MKKQIASPTLLAGALTLALLASAVMTAEAEEVVGTVIAPPVNRDNKVMIYYLDTTGNGIVDRYMTINDWYNSRELFEKLSIYLNEGWKIVFKGSGLQAFENFGAGCMLAIISPEGRNIDLTQMVSLPVIREYLPDLYAKLVRESRVR